MLKVPKPADPVSGFQEPLGPKRPLCLPLLTSRCHQWHLFDKTTSVLDDLANNFGVFNIYALLVCIHRPIFT